MKRVLLFAAFIFFLACDTPADFEAYQKYFVKFLGGEGSQEGVDMVVDGQGNFYILGTSTLDPVRQISKIYLAKTNSEGNLISEIIYFNEEGNNTKYVARDIEIVDESTLAIAANVVNSDGDRDMFIMKINTSDLSVVQQRTITFSIGPANSDEDVRAVTRISDGYMLSGYTNNLQLKFKGPQGTFLNGDEFDYLNVRLDNNLDINPGWIEAFGEGTIDQSIKMFETQPGFFLMFGSNNGPVGADFDLNFRARNFDNGAISVSNVYAGLVGTSEICYSVARSLRSSNAGFLVSGISISANNLSTLYVARFPSTSISAGTEPIENNLGIQISEQIDQSSINTALAASISGEFYLIANQQGTSVDERNILLTKIANDGTLAWPVPVIFGGEFDDTIGSVTELSDGSIVIVGTFGVGGNQKKIALLKVNAEGKFIE